MKKVFLTIIFVITVTITFSVFSSSAEAGTIIDTGYTYTKYPIVLVGGILNQDMFDYFHGVNYWIERDAFKKTWETKSFWGIPYRKLVKREQQQVHFIMLSPLEEINARGKDLAEKIEEFLVKNPDVKKVNIIAHSHGATTARVAIVKLKGKVASLTTIAGPHFGTASADASTLPMLPTILKGAIFYALDIAGNFFNLLTDLAYGVIPPDGEIENNLDEYYFNQNMKDVAEHFTQKGIEEFNTKFPSAGLPTRPDKDDVIPHERADTLSGITYGGQDSYNGRPYYGKDYTQEGAPAGDGFGNALEPTNENAILYYSWTGKTTSPQTTLGLDPVDLSMMATHALSQIYYDYANQPEVDPGYLFTLGQFVKYYLNSFWWNCKSGLNTEDPDFFQQINEEEFVGGFITDGFIPVSSARFGEYIGTFGPWNHLDEQNQFLGFVGSLEKPVQAFVNHANRLKKANR